MMTVMMMTMRTTSFRTRPQLLLKQVLLTVSTGLLLLLLSSSLSRVSASVVVEIASGGKNCYYLRVPDDRPSVISGNFDLLDDEASSAEVVTATLTKLSGKDGKVEGGGTTIWTSSEEDTEDTFSFTVDAIGRYSFCISVQPLGDDDAVDQADTYPIGFNLRLDPLPRSLPSQESGPEAEIGMHLIETASFIENDWKNLLDHFDYLRSREATYVQLTNQISERLMGWNIIEATLVVTMAVGQVIYWKKFFETRRYL